MTTFHRHKHQKATKALIVKKSTKPKLVDRLIYFAAIVEPLFSLPQAYTIFHNQAAANVSILSWAGFEIMTAIWVWYAIVHKEKMILIYQGMFLVVNGLILGGAIYYGGQLL